jgi:soluble lytic murein transglycosylase
VLAKTMIEYCRTYEMDPAFILAVIQVESRFQSNSKSHKNAQGLMQVLPSTAQYLVEKNKLNAKDFLNLHDPVVSLKLGILYFSEIRRLFKNDSYYYHVAAYNLGPSKLKKLRQNKNFKPDQTLVYYKKIMAHYRRLRKLEVYSFEI